MKTTIYRLLVTKTDEPSISLDGSDTKDLGAAKERGRLLVRNGFFNIVEVRDLRENLPVWVVWIDGYKRNGQIKMRENQVMDQIKKARSR